jgi:hypothetical protein
MRLMLVGALAALAVGAYPRSLPAQSPGVALIAPTSEKLRATAALRPVPTLSFAGAQPSLVAQVENVRGGRRQGEILMIVGGAVILTGLLVDESLVTIAGVAVGGYGLYLYLQATR